MKQSFVFNYEIVLPGEIIIEAEDKAEAYQRYCDIEKNEYDNLVVGTQGNSSRVYLASIKDNNV